MSQLISPRHGPAGSHVGKVLSVAHHRNGCSGQSFHSVHFEHVNDDRRKVVLVANVLDTDEDARLGLVGCFVTCPDEPDQGFRGDVFASALREVIAQSQWPHEVEREKTRQLAAKQAASASYRTS